MRPARQLIAPEDQPSLFRSAFDSGRLSPRLPRVATAMIAPASTTIPSMITNTSNCGRSTTAWAGGVHDGVVHGMEQARRSTRWNRRCCKKAQRSSTAQLREQEDAQHQRRGRP